MAKVEVIVLVDDLNGSTEDVETVKFSLDGKDYEIDLDPQNAAELRNILAKYIQHARGFGKAPAPGTVNQLIRQWAKSKGRGVSARGKIPEAVLIDFAAAHPNPS